MMELNIIPKFLDNALSPVAKEAGETLSDIINLARTPLIKARKIRDLKMEHFLQNLACELKNVPEENIVEPKLSIIGPALEDLFKYYMEEDHIVALYQKLIIAAMKKTEQQKVHPSFLGVVKQMTSLDALTFQMVCKNKQQEVYTGHIRIRDIYGTKLGYRIAFWDNPLKSESNSADLNCFDQDICWGLNLHWDLALCTTTVDALHNLKVLGVVNTQKTIFNEKTQYEPYNDGYLNSRMQDIVQKYKDNLNLRFELYRERVIVYFLTDYGKRLADLIIS